MAALFVSNKNPLIVLIVCFLDETSGAEFVLWPDHSGVSCLLQHLLNVNHMLFDFQISLVQR